MSEYWLISAPGDKTCQQTFDTMNNLTSKQHNLCNNYKFHIPDLKVGTLDQLVGLSDDLGKLDTYVEQITRKVAAYLGEVLEDQRDKLHENLLANNIPDPPDDSTLVTTQQRQQHTPLTGKSSNLSNSRDTTTTTCSACHSGGSCLNLTSSQDDSERDYEYIPSPSSLAALCHCDDCLVSSEHSVAPSSSITASNFMAEVDSYSHSSSGAGLSKHSCGMSANTSYSHSTNASASAAGGSSSAHNATSPSSCSTYYFSTSAPTTSAKRYSNKKFHSQVPPSNSNPQNPHQHHNNNNNTYTINNNSKLGLSSSNSHLLMHHQHPAMSQLNSHCYDRRHQQPQQQQPQLQHHREQQTHSPYLVRHPHSVEHRLNSDDVDDGGGEALKKNNSTSDLSDTFDWWFHRRKRSTKKSSHRCTFSQLNINRGLNVVTSSSLTRSSPVSSCCGSSSHGRTSPDTDTAEPPAFPLSPADLSVYLTRFQWDMAKYPIKQSLRNIADIISKQIGQIDADLKTKSNAYNNLKGSLQNLEKKQTGSLLTRNLADLVKKEHFILDSEYLTTLLVIVPKAMAKDWLANYEKITDMIVPRSSQLIYEDNDFGLFNVTLFKKVVEEFKLHARERKFIVRDFVYNEEELAAGKNEITKLITDKKKQFGPLVRWLKVNFSEAFCALVHVKALRVFVESVLRYGLPVNFQAILIEPHKKSIKRLREDLNQLYGHLDGASSGGQGSSTADTVDIPGLGFGQSEYYPYVFYKINIDMVETQKL